MSNKRKDPFDKIEPEFPIPENDDGPVTFEPDVDKTALPGGGFKRGEALQLSEEEDDFEDGRSSAGTTSRSEADQWARGDVGSRAAEGSDEQNPPP